MMRLAAALALLALSIMPARADDAPPPGPPADAKPRVIAVYGDSQGQGIAGGMQRALKGSKLWNLHNRTQPGSAIIHPKDYDWPAAIDKAAASEKPDVAVMVFGGNDRLDWRIEGEPKLTRFRTQDWRDKYAAKVHAMMQAMKDAGSVVIWCGNPISRQPEYGADMEYINAIYQEEAEKVGVTYFPLWTVIADEKGQYASHGPGIDGTTQRLRGEDGIHFTAAGYDVVAKAILQAVEAHAPPRS